MYNKILIMLFIAPFLFSMALASNLNKELESFLIGKQPTQEEQLSQDNLLIDIVVKGQEKPNGFVIPRITAYLFLDYLYTKKTFELTIEFCQAFIKADPKDGYAYYKMGESYEALGKIDQAIEAYNNTIGNSPNFVFPYFRLWGIYTYDKNRPIEADNYFKKFEVALLKPSKLSLTRQKELLIKDLFLLGEYFLNESREFDKAIKLFQMVLKLNQNQERAKLNIAMCQVNKSIVLKDKKLFNQALNDIKKIGEGSENSEVVSFINQFLKNKAPDIRKKLED